MVGKIKYISFQKLLVHFVLFDVSVDAGHWYLSLTGSYCLNS